MRKSQLLELLSQGQHSGLVFLRDDVSNATLGLQAVALLNCQGGYVLLGVEDDGSVSGIQRPDLERWIMDTVFGRYVHPMVLPFFEQVVCDDGKRVGVISLMPGVAKPYVLRYCDREEIYVRVGSTSKLATREQQARLFESGGLLHAEVLPVNGTSLGDLDQARLADYLVNIAGDLESPATEQDWLQRLTGLGFMTGDNAQPAVCTIAGLVLFGRNPKRYLRHASIRWMSFDGLDMDYRSQDDTFMTGPLVALFEGKIGSGREIIEPGLIERLVDRMLPFISEQSNSIDTSLRRSITSRYPLEALREAILNAAVHRDWTRSIEIGVTNYADRLEVTSPGALQNSMTLDKMFAGQRSPRNPIIMEVMRDYGYVDARGMGVRRKIVPLTREYCGQDATFELTDDYLKVTIPARTQMP
ncbi:MAG TPA: ATP-binding protein [Orrella sp.]